VVVLRAVGYWLAWRAFLSWSMTCEYRSDSQGDNLFLSSIVALNADTGAYVWHYQATPEVPQTGAETPRLARLARHPRWTFHFTPTSASRLNAVEGFFAQLTRRRLRRGTFGSVGELKQAINRFNVETNDDPKALRLDR
jgi:hypothetical protein